MHGPLIYSPESKRGQRRKLSPLGRAALARQRATVLFVFKDNFSARRATVFTPNLLELFSNGRTGERKGAWDFSWEKGWDEVTSPSVSPCSKPQVLEAGGAGNPLLRMRIPASGPMSRPPSPVQEPN